MAKKRPTSSQKLSFEFEAEDIYAAADKVTPIAAGGAAPLGTGPKSVSNRRCDIDRTSASFAQCRQITSHGCPAMPGQSGKKNLDRPRFSKNVADVRLDKGHVAASNPELRNEGP